MSLARFRPPHRPLSRLTLAGLTLCVAASCSEGSDPAPAFAGQQFLLETYDAGGSPALLGYQAEVHGLSDGSVLFLGDSFPGHLARVAPSGSVQYAFTVTDGQVMSLESGTSPLCWVSALAGEGIVQLPTGHPTQDSQLQYTKISSPASLDFAYLEPLVVSGDSVLVAAEGFDLNTNSWAYHFGRYTKDGALANGSVLEASWLDYGVKVGSGLRFATLLDDKLEGLELVGLDADGRLLFRRTWEFPEYQGETLASGFQVTDTGEQILWRRVRQTSLGPGLMIDIAGWDLASGTGLGSHQVYSPETDWDPSDLNVPMDARIVPGGFVVLASNVDGGRLVVEAFNWNGSRRWSRDYGLDSGGDLVCDPSSATTTNGSLIVPVTDSWNADSGFLGVRLIDGEATLHTTSSQAFGDSIAVPAEGGGTDYLAFWLGEPGSQTVARFRSDGTLLWSGLMQASVDWVEQIRGKLFGYSGIDLIRLQAPASFSAFQATNMFGRIKEVKPIKGTGSRRFLPALAFFVSGDMPASSPSAGAPWPAIAQVDSEYRLTSDCYSDTTGLFQGQSPLLRTLSQGSLQLQRFDLVPTIQNTTSSPPAGFTPGQPAFISTTPLLANTYQWSCADDADIAQRGQSSENPFGERGPAAGVTDRQQDAWLSLRQLSEAHRDAHWRISIPRRITGPQASEGIRHSASDTPR